MTTPAPMLLLRAAQALTMCPTDSPGPLPAHADAEALRAHDDALVGLQHDVAVLIEGDRIGWVGPWDRRPKRAKRDGVQTLQTRVLMPAWIDAAARPIHAPVDHSALAWQASRQAVDDAAHLDAVLRTAAATRELDHQALGQALARFVFESVRQGAVRLAVRTGYGLSVKRELAMLRLINEVAAEVPCELIPILTPGLIVPPEQPREEHMRLMIDTLLPAAARGLSATLEIPCFPSGYTRDEAARLADAARAYGWRVRTLGDMASGLELDADVCHLLHPVPAAQHARFADRSVLVAPGLHLLTQRHRPAMDLRALQDAGARVAIATGVDAETTTSQDLGFALRGAVAMGLTPGEALRAITREAAFALGDEAGGQIVEGARADLAMFDVSEYALLTHRFGMSHAEGVIWAGEFVYWTESDDV